MVEKNRVRAILIILLLLLVLSSFTIKGLSTWLQFQSDLNSSGIVSGIGYFNNSLISILNRTDLGMNFQPLVGEIEADNHTKIVIFNSTKLFILDRDLFTINSTDLNGNLLGQPIIFNADDDSSLEIIFNYNISETHQFIVYNYTNFNFSREFNLTIANKAIGAGVKCTTVNGIKTCVFKDNKDNVCLVNMSSRSIECIGSSSGNDVNESIPSIADYDNDGKLEAVFYNSTSYFFVFDLQDKIIEARGNTDPGVFQKVGQPVFAQVDSGAVDVVLLGKYANAFLLTIFENNAEKAQFAAAAILGAANELVSHTPIITDCNNNGQLDVLFHSYDNGAVTVMKTYCYNGTATRVNTNPAGFQDAIDITGKTIAGADMNNDSKIEFITYEGIYNLSGYRIFDINGIGTQAPIPVDVNNNSQLDLLWTNSSSGLKLFTVDISAPRYFNINIPSPVYKNDSISINITWIDYGGISIVNVSHNATGTWANYTAGNLGNNVYNASINSVYINETSKTIGFIFYSVDANGNRNETTLQSVTVSNRNPLFIGTVPNLTWNEDSSISINISSNFTDPDSDILTYNFSSSDSFIQNISVAINQSTGIVTFTSDPNFFGIRNIFLIANDSFGGGNISNNITLNVTNLNDPPEFRNLAINSSDTNNRTNGSLTANFSFFDIDGDLQSSIEIKWYRNGSEITSIANATLIGFRNLSKTEIWLFSIRGSDNIVLSNFSNSTPITIRNSLPYFIPSLENQTIELENTLIYDINATDTDNDMLAFSDNSSEFNISANGQINWTPALTGNYSIAINVSDSIEILADQIMIFVVDTTPPFVTTYDPNSSVTSSSITLTATTNENSSCRYSEVNGTNYSQMSSQFTDNGKIHTISISSLSNGFKQYFIRCNDTSGNVALNDYIANFTVTLPSQPSSGGGSSGGGGGSAFSSGYICDLEWVCQEWSACIDGKRERKCSLTKSESKIKSKNPCNYDLSKPSTSESCGLESKEINESCFDGVKNQNEENIDCGGSCKPCETMVNETLESNLSSNQITGAAVIKPNINGKYLPFTLILLVLAVLILSSFLIRQHIKKRENLTMQEQETLKEDLGQIQSKQLNGDKKEIPSKKSK